MTEEMRQVNECKKKDVVVVHSSWKSEVPRIIDNKCKKRKRGRLTERMERKSTDFGKRGGAGRGGTSCE